ncbi:carbon monoxide dehydrogenase [Cystobacter ferrugineus]|uniref:Carbon monoxide dehydrogenase n=2 Tax=Cystobacter ferrugineus TaxID=83449 RepID=A0A1L9BHC7_9BACT|nr:carbon monoxide dehydrogenase [Cystobacter ferrugineus]
MSMGKPLTRLDGADKVTGRARYAADQPLPDALHAVYVTAPIPAGRVTSIDTAEALAHPGVVRVLTARDMPRLKSASAPPAASVFMPLQGDEIRHEGQPVALVLAETLQAAEHGARLVRVGYAPGVFIPQGAGEPVVPRESGYIMGPADFAKGDLDAGLATAALRHEARYTQPSRHHNPMEPCATLARWDGDQLTVFDSVQHIAGTQGTLAEAFGLKPEQVRVICPHTGGGFGCKAYTWPHELLAAAAAKVAGRPVKLVLTRAQMYANVSYQPRVEQTVTLGATSEGRLTGIGQDVINQTSVSDDYVEYATEAGRALYATPTLRTSQRVRRGHVNIPSPMRAPVEGPGSFAMGCAVDELSRRVGIDPLDFRLLNYAENDPADGKPWSSKKLREAYDEGARRFGWRTRARGGTREGDWLLGCGMADCTMGAFRFGSTVRLRLRAEGTALLEGSSADIGTGGLTALPQIVSESLGIPVEAVTFTAGDSRLPTTGPTYGSSTIVCTGSAILDAATKIREQLARAADLRPEELELRDGRVRRKGGGAGRPLGEVLRRAGLSELTAEGKFAPNGEAANMSGLGTPYAMRTFGAVFVEVAVDPELGLLRLRRMVGAYSVGRIINPRTARSQIIGGMIWGWGMAAMEQSAHEPKLGRWLSKNLSGVAIPVNADIPSALDVIFVDEFDDKVSPLGAKGLGEIGATGVSAAIANAVYDAVGIRVRDLPITPDKLLAQ